MLYIFGAICLFLVQTDPAGAVCGNVVIWRNHNATCPSNAVCADVFPIERNWYNGTTCNETRVLNNCLCDGGTVCPVNNPQHMLYYSRRHQFFTCEQTCSRPWCQDIQSSPFGSYRSRPGRIPSTTVAVIGVMNSTDFERKNYYKLECRCPRHHFPHQGRRQAVSAYGYRYIYQTGSYHALYVCNTSRLEPRIEDPCLLHTSRD